MMNILRESQLVRNQSIKIAQNMVFPADLVYLLESGRFHEKLGDSRENQAGWKRTNSGSE